MTGSSPPSVVAETIARLRTLSQLDIRNQWRVCEHDLPVAEGCNPAHWQNWPIALLNENGYIVWERGHRIRWLCQQITVPHDLHGYALEGMVLRLALTVWTDPTHVFVNGQLVQECDLFDHSPRILLSERVTPGDTIAVALRAVSPGHDNGALMKSLCLYETPQRDAAYSGKENNHIREPSFLADELAALEIFLTTLAPEQLPLLEQAMGAIAWDAVHDPPRFQQSIHHLYQTLQPLADWIQQRQICLLGHSHLDLVWLWTWAETCDVAERMFKSVLSLQQDYADLVFCHSSPALYAWVEDHRPALFAAIQTQIQAGRWEALGGMWVEPELNLLHGESLVRQVLYGQRYVQSRFGRLDRIAWLPDSFGFCWQLPQILSQGGIKYLVTQKLTWNDRTKFPYAAFWWQAPDGSRVFTVMSSTVGEGIDPIKMATYASQWEKATNIPHALWLFGVGDHGGGPTRDMLEVAERWRRSSLFPKLTSSTALDYLQSICQPSSCQPSSADPNAAAFPTWADELYLECHRGSYTTHGDQKRWNRRCEALLYQAELWSSLMTIATNAPYPHAALDHCWRTLLFNQFHDILPGSSIPEVFVEANAAW
ncbi:MAG: alpha-mannosidase, partial [Cyanobacteria bacterium]|nr:alpha-mannosidase [Cyanobacteriota bacterium]MDW8200804.1 alpha-mannosidase [Cyanobacteriota bacterium SKYGB_h_bin112]